MKNKGVLKEGDQMHKEEKNNIDWRSIIMTETKWRKFSRELREEIMDIIPKNQVIGRYADEVVNALKMYNKFELAGKVEKELRANILHEPTDRGEH